eukprot:TRINITY_DN2562_c0_g1_i1.p1 TRINITY_DN2562_c0_g1~~TRINITY_DN2562_c0_g1_i1.p1  ORF type:complete len:460 (+),score=119.38 TRINITY_DN2562_c0_g1_i1:62-1441(+)
MFNSCAAVTKSHASSRSHQREKLRQLLKDRCAKMFSQVQTDMRGEASCQEILALLPEVETLFDEFQIAFARHDFEEMIYIMDQDDSGGIDKGEFCRGIMQLAEGLQPISIIEIHCDLAYVKGQVQTCLQKLVKNEESITESRMVLADIHGSLDMMARYSGDYATTKDLAETRQSMLDALEELRGHVRWTSHTRPLLEALAAWARSSEADIAEIKRSTTSLQGDIRVLAERVEHLARERAPAQTAVAATAPAVAATAPAVAAAAPPLAAAPSTAPGHAQELQGTLAAVADQMLALSREVASLNARLPQAGAAVAPAGFARAAEDGTECLEAPTAIARDACMNALSQSVAELQESQRRVEEALSSTFARREGFEQSVNERFDRCEALVAGLRSSIASEATLPQRPATSPRGVLAGAAAAALASANATGLGGGTAPDGGTVAAKDLCAPGVAAEGSANARGG